MVVTHVYYSECIIQFYVSNSIILFMSLWSTQSENIRIYFFNLQYFFSLVKNQKPIQKNSFFVVIFVSADAASIK